MLTQRAAFPVSAVVDDDVGSWKLNARTMNPPPQRHIADAAVFPLHDRSGNQVVVVSGNRLMCVHDHNGRVLDQAG